MSDNLVRNEPPLKRCFCVLCDEETTHQELCGDDFNCVDQCLKCFTIWDEKNVEWFNKILASKESQAQKERE